MAHYQWVTVYALYVMDLWVKSHNDGQGFFFFVLHLHQITL